MALLVQYDASFPLKSAVSLRPKHENTRLLSDPRDNPGACRPEVFMKWSPDGPCPGFSSRLRRRARLFGEDCVWGSRINPGANLGVNEGNFRHPVTDSVGCSNDQPFHGGTNQLFLLHVWRLVNRLDDVFLTLSHYVLPPASRRCSPFHLAQLQRGDVGHVT